MFYCNQVVALHCTMHRWNSILALFAIILSIQSMHQRVLYVFCCSMNSLSYLIDTISMFQLTIQSNVRVPMTTTVPVSSSISVNIIASINKNQTVLHSTTPFVVADHTTHTGFLLSVSVDLRLIESFLRLIYSSCLSRMILLKFSSRAAIQQREMPSVNWSPMVLRYTCRFFLKDDYKSG
jgi:hypothetical protein